MQKRPENDLSHQAGDKIKIKSGSCVRQRGVITQVRGGWVEVRLDTNEMYLVQTSIEEITNFSLAARKAWQSMPKRAGRPSGKVPAKKPVSLRIESETWDRLAKAVEAGLISSREEAINKWLKQMVDVLEISREEEGHGTNGSSYGESAKKQD